MPTGRHAATGDLPIERITAGVDWITIITDTRSESEELAARVVELGRAERAAGASVKPFRFMGYTGQMVGGVRLGFNGAAAVAQLSGELCSQQWTSLVSSPGRVTRLDLQTTISLSSSRAGFARSLLRRSTRITQKNHRTPIRTSYSSDTSGLAIGTVGRRTSPRYLRVYDKGVETRTAPPGTKWRVELEAKHGLGGVLWETLKNQRDVPAWCYGTCEAQWRSSGLSWPLPASSLKPEVATAPGRKEAPAHTLAAWLRSSVSPVIPRVLTAYTVAELLAMLGLDGMAIPTEPNSDA